MWVSLVLFFAEDFGYYELVSMEEDYVSWVIAKESNTCNTLDYTIVFLDYIFTTFPNNKEIMEAFLPPYTLELWISCRAWGSWLCAIQLGVSIRENSSNSFSKHL